MMKGNYLSSRLKHRLFYRVMWRKKCFNLTNVLSKLQAPYGTLCVNTILYFVTVYKSI